MVGEENYSQLDYYLRPAEESDFPNIRRLIHQVRINPTGLDWRRFTVAVLPSGELIACGQLKPVPGGLTELASLAVRAPFREQGIARDIIAHLLAQAPRPIYLTCASRTGGLYEKFGFHVLEFGEIPKYYRRLLRLANTFMKHFDNGETLLVMKLG